VTTAGWILVATFAVWATASLAAQVNSPATARLRRLDVLHLLPRWRFFAPSPITSDHLVSYRAWNADGCAVLDWTRLTVPGDRRLIDAVFNRHRRARKAQRATCSYVLRHQRDGQLGKPLMTPSYLLLLAAVSSECARRAPDATITQFRIARTLGYHLHPVVVSSYLSAKHQL
jgi:hypothetical protein